MAQPRRRLLPVILVLIASTLAAHGVTPAQADPPASFTFGAAGDLGASANSAATLTAVAGSGTDLFFAVGDLSYNEVTPESAWCNFVTTRVGSGYPFELVSGNHEDNGPDGLIKNYAACLPDRIGNVTGSYAKEYFVDYPTAAPLARFIMISPALSFPGESQYTYTQGNAHYTWLANAIDTARAGGIRWVIVGMHEVCLNAGSLSCSIGTDLLNLLVAKKVDLVLQGHEHTYQRSKQLALGASCTAVTPGSFKAGCVADDGADGVYSKGAGPVIVIAGTGGKSLSSASPSDSDGPYFAKLMGGNSNPTNGFVRYQVSADQISAQFIRSARGNFTDSFTITSAGVANRPTASAVSATTTAGTTVPVTLAGSDVETCELGFAVTATPAHGLLSAVNDEPCTPGTPNRDTAVVTYTPDAGFTGTDTFTYQVSDGTSTSDPATATVTVTPTGGGGGVGISFRSASSGQNPTSATLSLATPAGATAGDVMVAAVTLRGSATITPPPGWTFVRSDDAHYVLQAVYVRAVGAGDPPSWTWNFSAAVPAAGGILDYAGVNTAAPVDVHGGMVTTTATTTIPAPSITTTVAGDAIVGLFGIGGGNAITPPAGMVERGEAVSSAGSLHATWEGSDFTQAAAGATGTKTATATVAHPSVGQLVALRPA